MKRRIISLALALVMLFAALPSFSMNAEAANHTIVMTADEFINCLKTALSRKNVYKNTYPYNLGYYDGSTISWDCWNLGKSIIWTKGSIVNNYTAGTHAKVDTSCGLGDWDGLTIIQQAPNCSGDFSYLVPGEWLYMDGHTGYYIGDGQVIECTAGWGVYGITVSQIDTYGNRSRNGVSGGKWLYHGMVPWIDYTAVESTSFYTDLLLDINWTNIDRVGRQTPYSYSCSCFALAYSRTLLDDTVHYFYEYNQYGNTEYNVNALWYVGQHNSAYYSTRNEAFSKLYTDLCNGKPAIVYVTGRQSEGHYVTVVGFQNVSSLSNLSENNFLIIDPVWNDGHTAVNLGGVGYTLRDSHQVVYDQSSASVSFTAKGTTNSKPSKSESAGFISRCDGLWLWPTSYYTISDWAGCNASPSVNSKCQFCGTQHGTCGLEHATALGHSGIDILINAGSQVYAAAPGTLYCTNTDWENRGITAVVEHPISGTGYSYYSVYQQLSSTVVEKNGKAVKAGDVIAATGSTNGFGTGYAHLHFEILMGTKGQGKALAEAPNTKITAIENCGWITANKYATGLIVTNPALNSPAGTPVYTYGCESNVRAHAGSVMYTRNAADVSIGNAQEKPAVTYNTADVVAMSGTYTVTVSGANIWSKPYSSGTSKLVRTAAKGADLTVTGKVTNSAGSLWYKLSDGNWVYSSNVTKKVIKDTTTYREIDVVPCSGIYAISSNGANIWSKPFSSGSSKVVATYKKGTQLAIVAKVVNSAGSTWVQLSEGGWVYFGNVTRKTAITYNPENVVTVSGTYTVTSWGANVWSNPFTVGSTKVVRSVSKNAALAVTGRVVNSAGDTWYELSDGNWIFSGNVTRKSAITYNTANMVNYKASFKVISWGANLWSKPYSSGDSKVVRTVAKDATLSVVAKVTNSAGDIWYKLSDGCWVYGKNVTRK